MMSPSVPGMHGWGNLYHIALSALMDCLPLVEKVCGRLFSLASALLESWLPKEAASVDFSLLPAPSSV